MEIKFRHLSGFLLLLFSQVAAFGHLASITQIEAKVSSHFLELKFDLNKADILQNILYKNYPGSQFQSGMDSTLLKSSDPLIAEYIKSHVHIEMDGTEVHSGEVIGWPARETSVHDGDERSLPPSTTLQFILRWPIRPGAVNLNLSFHLYETGFSPIFEIRIVDGSGTLSQVQHRGPGQNTEVDLKTLNGPPSHTQMNHFISRTTPSYVMQMAGRFIWLGITHILPQGLDHILFVLGLYLLSPRLKPLLLQVTAFTIAHSITLALSVLGIFSLSSRIVEPLIALSITVIAIENLFQNQVRPSRWVVVFGFGLIHGLGFAGVLQEAGRLPEQRIPCLIGFNVGVELGQLAVIAIAFCLTGWCQSRPWFRPYVRNPLSMGIALIGLFWACQRVLS